LLVSSRIRQELYEARDETNLNTDRDWSRRVRAKALKYLTGRI